MRCGFDRWAGQALEKFRRILTWEHLVCLLRFHSQHDNVGVLAELLEGLCPARVREIKIRGRQELRPSMQAGQECASPRHARIPVRNALASRFPHIVHADGFRGLCTKTRW